MIIENYEFIAHHIQTCNTHEQLVTCQHMIEERIVKWGFWDMAESLAGLILVREVELIAQRYPEEERL